MEALPPFLFSPRSSHPAVYLNTTAGFTLFLIISFFYGPPLAYFSPSFISWDMSVSALEPWRIVCAGQLHGKKQHPLPCKGCLFRMGGLSFLFFTNRLGFGTVLTLLLLMITHLEVPWPSSSTWHSFPRQKYFPPFPRFAFTLFAAMDTKPRDRYAFL